MAYEPEELELTADDCIPRGVDVDEVIAEGWERDLTAVWRTYHAHAAALGLDPNSDEPLQVSPEITVTEGEFQRRLAEKNAEYAPVTAIQALTANARLVDLLLDFRWVAVNDALNDGKSWTDIAAVLGTTEQSVLEWYTSHRRAASALEKS
ncbi:hypothetical protein U3653_23025 [Nocardia sp. CDC186]|uniref:Uncharacterized protein n=1 Tax=Nocardia implantans TaxID=3108168 RepID=A0ABU6AZH7_9NOCA|nr:MULTISPECIES: hypothetical protein [unclassified Nocardia]MBF6191340.1 hypothetical protein [Nocardia beijingensis]MEA3532981.1 hypothetical protein [Nocardia sp. CDC192]MEB3512913.1 hypothetical protein [Nocardia sp. CDC186]